MAQKEHTKVTVGFVALGCPKNIVDSERMLAQIAQAGFLVTADPTQADAVVINTCGFIEPAKVESIEAVRRALADKERGHVAKVIVTGCLSQRMGERLLDEARGIDAVVGLEHRDAIAQVISQTMTSDGPLAYVGPAPSAVADDRTRLRIGPAHSAYLRISEGCNHRCSFCTIPAIRGPFRSKPPDAVLDEARELVSSGVVEVNLIGQDTTRYGSDVKMKDGLAHLVRDIERLPDLEWIRLLYAYPAGITETLMETIATSEKVVRYLDIPVQHASEKVLRAMRRPDTSEGLRNLIERLRSAMSDIALRTTVIVGFPGETDAEFEELVDFIKWAQFDALGAFPFYPETGTPAADFPDQVADEIKQARLDELMLTQQEMAFAKNNTRVGSELVCLVDSLDGRGMGRGRFYGQAPEIDSICIVKGCSAAPGQFVKVRVVGTQDYDLVVEQI